VNKNYIIIMYGGDKMGTDFDLAGKKLREIRKSKGVSIRELERRIGYARSYISNIENGKKRANVEFLAKAADALNVDIAEFFADKIRAPEELQKEGVEWLAFGKELEKEGITIEQVKEWVRAIRATRGL
jgi:XRE family transcriptional regulator, master regulator for biofilm formation